MFLSKAEIFKTPQRFQKKKKKERKKSEKQNKLEQENMYFKELENPGGIRLRPKNSGEGSPSERNTGDFLPFEEVFTVRG